MTQHKPGAEVPTFESQVMQPDLAESGAASGPDRFDPKIGWIRHVDLPRVFTPDELRDAAQKADEASKGYARATGGYALLSDGQIYEGWNGRTYQSESVANWLRGRSQR